PVGDFFFLAIDQIAQSGLSSLKVIYYSAQLFSNLRVVRFYAGGLSRKPGFFRDQFLRECHTNDRLSDCH
ncbi:hypothetical protein, partial [Escherichia coli]|uniref:hypothetical protein n=1 Tax=Escherichia coli TaxID=562 RepID=UPI001F2B6B8B